MTSSAPRMPPRWFVRSAWAVHRALFAVTRGRLGVWKPTAKGAGMLRLRTTRRRTGEERRAMLGYLEDGSNVVLVAMNGWAAPDRHGRPAGLQIMCQIAPSLEPDVSPRRVLRRT